MQNISRALSGTVTTRSPAPNFMINQYTEGAMQINALPAHDTTRMHCSYMLRRRIISLFGAEKVGRGSKCALLSRLSGIAS